MGPNGGCDFFSTYVRIRKNSLGITVQSLGRHMMDKHRRDRGSSVTALGTVLGKPKAMTAVLTPIRVTGA